MTVAVLVLGAGRGERFRASRDSLADGAGVDGSAPRVPKAFVPLAGRPLIVHSLQAFARAAAVDSVQPVLSAEGMACWPEALRHCADRDLRPVVAEPVLGGPERADSVRRGLAALGGDVHLVAVHDAARPLVCPGDIDAVVALAEAHGAALLATPVVDTIHRVVDGCVAESPDRSTLWAAATPQVFRKEWLECALESALADGVAGSDDASLVARIGHRVFVAQGAAGNLKITTEVDRVAAEAWLARRERDGAS